jgi:hypothetical protein
MSAQAFTATGTETINAPPVVVASIDFTQSFSKMPRDPRLIKFGVNYYFKPMPVAVAKY